MSKLAQAVTDESVAEGIADAGISNESVQLKKLTEDQIRMKLDQFAKELSRVRKERGEH